MKYTCSVYTFLSGSQCEKYLFSPLLSISALGTLNEMTSYGSAANMTYWYFLSHASTFCSYELINRCRGLAPSSISG